MIQRVLIIRLKQLGRLLKDVGIMRILFMIAVLIFVFLTIVKYLSGEYHMVVSGFFLLLIFLIHQKRRDKLFLKICNQKYKNIFLSEYLIIVLPLLVGHIFFQNFFDLPIVLVSVFLISRFEFHLNVKRKATGSFVHNWIPDHSFEWKAGIRKNLFQILVLWTVGVGASFFIGTVPVVLLVLGFLPGSFYEEGEPLNMLMAGELGANRLLLQKLRTHLLLYASLNVPLVLAFIIFHYEYWYISVAIFLLLLFVQPYIVLLKYAFYEPGQQSASGQIFQSLAFMSVFFPFLVPVVWILSVKFYLQAADNLKTYLHDFD